MARFTFLFKSCSVRHKKSCFLLATMVAGGNKVFKNELISDIVSWRTSIEVVACMDQVTVFFLFCLTSTQNCSISY
jgi:hypothetical protein